MKPSKTNQSKAKQQTSEKQKPITKQQILAIVVGTIAIIIVIQGILVIGKELLTIKKEQILNDPIYATAVITDKHSYKGKAISIEYLVSNKKYSYRTSVDEVSFQKYSVGDSIEIIYSQPYPSEVVLAKDVTK